MKLPLSLLLLACAPACFAKGPAPAPHVQATIAMRDPGALDVSYEIPASCTALEFLNDGMRPETVAGLRRDWTALDDCTEFDGRRITRKNPSCSTLRLRVPASNRTVDRVYPWAYPVEKGLYVHTSAYALAPACGPVDWTFLVPGGTVVVDGVARAERGARSAAAGGGEALPAVLIQQPYQAGSMKRIHASADFTPSTMAFLNATFARIERELKAELPGVSFTRPFIVASSSDHPGNYWGDVANRTVMRLAFWPEPGPGQEQVLHSFVTHEMAHLTQPSDWNDSWRRDGEDEATIGEGGAEFLRAVTAARLGWSGRDGFKEDLERAVNSCLVAADGKPWTAMRNRGWGTNPYDCGLAFHALALASPQAKGSPLLRLRDYNRSAKRGERTDFARALECGGARECQPRWLPRLAGDEALEAVLGNYAREKGSLLRPSADVPAAMVKPLAYRHVGKLMQADCKGAMSYNQEPGAVRIGAGPACGVLLPDMVVVSAEGLPLFEDARAVKASVQACREQGKTVLGLKDGGSVTLACGASVSLPVQMFAVDPVRARGLLK